MSTVERIVREIHIDVLRPTAAPANSQPEGPGSIKLVWRRLKSERADIAGFFPLERLRPILVDIVVDILEGVPSKSNVLKPRLFGSSALRRETLRLAFRYAQVFSYLQHIGSAIPVEYMARSHQLHLLSRCLTKRVQ